MTACHGARPPGAILAGFQEAASDRFVPVNATVEITLRCNLRCAHCYNFDRAGPMPAAAREGELAPEEVFRVLADLRELGCLFLSLTGGEAFSHPRFFDYMDRARALNLAVDVLSNGTLLAPADAARLAAYPNLSGASVSVYGATAETHDAITQVAGSFRRTLEGAARLRDLGVSVRLKFILMKRNLAEAAAMMALGRSFGLPFKVDPSITGRYDGEDPLSSLSTRIDAEDLDALYAGPLREFVPAAREAGAKRPLVCNCARGMVAVTSRGDVYPCISVPLPAGNVRERPLAEIWRDSPVFRRIRSLGRGDFEACAPCPWQGVCRRSPGASVILDGNYTGVDPWNCGEAKVLDRLARERAAAEALAP